MPQELAHSFNVKLDSETIARLQAEQNKLREKFVEQRKYDSSPHLAIATKFMGADETDAFVSALENEFQNESSWELEFSDFRLSNTGDYIFLHLSPASEQKLVEVHKRAIDATQAIGLEVQTGSKFRHFAYSPHISIIKVLPEEAERALALVRDDLSGVRTPVKSLQITRQEDVHGGFSNFPVIHEIHLK